jgi:hypothetical protein
MTNVLECFDLRDVRAVLLPDGWHPIERGSFEQHNLPLAGYAFVDLSGVEPVRMFVPAASILAVTMID